MAHPVMWFEVMGANAEALRTFYGSVFGWTFDANNPTGYGMVDTKSDKGIPGGIGSAANGGWRDGVTFYIESGDVAATLAEVERRGGRTLMPRTQLPDVTLGMFADPEGHVIGLVETR